MPDYLDSPVEAPAAVPVTGRFVFAKGQAAGGSASTFTSSAAFQAGFPWRSQGEWLLQQCGELLGKSVPPERVKALVQQTYRTDLYREAARLSGAGLPQPGLQAGQCARSGLGIRAGVEVGSDLQLRPNGALSVII